MRSDKVTKGIERAPMRSLFYAMGYTKEELERPLIGVVSAKSEIVPGHMHLDKVAEAVKAGVRMAGGTPIEVPSIGVCDGIAMGHVGMKYSLPSRELIADSVETMTMAHAFDGLVLVPNCDKIVPGMIMAAVRTVSYTHLDVYKRQIILFAKAEQEPLQKATEKTPPAPSGLHKTAKDPFRSPSCTLFRAIL